VELQFVNRLPGCRIERFSKSYWLQISSGGLGVSKEGLGSKKGKLSEARSLSFAHPTPLLPALTRERG
jgi:hypothetical protein